LHARSSRGQWLSGAVLLAAVVGGCAGPLDPATRPVLATGDGTSSATIGIEAWARNSPIYPLEIGNRWRHARVYAVTIVPDDGKPAALSTYHSERESELLCTQSFDGVPYVVERAIEREPQRMITAWIFYRQDATGLYERDVLGTDPPPCQGTATEVADRGAAKAPLDENAIEGLLVARPVAEREGFGVALRALRERVAALDRIRPAGAGVMLASTSQGAGPGELTRLSYPLERRQRWAVRDEPTFRMTATVEGLEALDLPPGRLRGYRIRLETAAFGPKDVVRVWYGRSGYLQLVAHFELDATDVEGNLVGRAIIDQRETLVDLSLAGELVAQPPKLRGG